MSALRDGDKRNSFLKEEDFMSLVISPKHCETNKTADYSRQSLTVAKDQNETQYKKVLGMSPGAVSTTDSLNSFYIYINIY